MFSSNIRIKSTILIFSFLLSLILFLTLHTTKLEEYYGFISVDFLFLAMLAGPLYRIFPTALFKQLYRSSLGGLGISAFYFAFLHSCITFFFQLLGFGGLRFLDIAHFISVLFGAVSLFILAILAGTSFTFAMKLLGPKWKVIHRFVYLAFLTLVLHIILFGSHFMDFTNPVALIFIVMFLILVVLHAVSFKRYLQGKFPHIQSRIVTTLICFTVIVSLYVLYNLHEIVTGSSHLHT